MVGSVLGAACAVAGLALLINAPSYGTFLLLYVALILCVSEASTARARATMGAAQGRLPAHSNASVRLHCHRRHRAERLRHGDGLSPH